MNKIELLPHNEVAYKKLLEKLENNDFVSINHATGTGKSFIILKYLNQNKEKKILYLAPSYPILEQLVNEHMEELGIDVNSFSCLDTEIYSNLIKKDMNNIASKYDLIILDEYHRCGAKKWGEKIEELFSIIKSSSKKVNVIGTTATEIRYLDYERNMNDILFNGVTASTLTLADAMLQGILPVFEYFTSSYDVLEKLNIIEKRVNKFLIYEEDRNKYIKVINNLRTKSENAIRVENNYSYCLHKNGKFLVFSSSLKDIQNDKQIMNKILSNHLYKEYEVTYKKGWKRNNDTILKFRNSSKDMSHVLYAVNILNEGVHVKDVDAIFMLRKTSSPIIYFQQLGRLLSYSRRKDKLLVFDLKNNIRNNSAIYDLYIEVVSKARELLKSDSDNKERYQYIIDNFKIVDIFSDIYKEIDKLNNITSVDNLKISRLNSAIKVLEENECDNYLKIQSLLDVYHYQQYVTFSQFKKIKTLEIDKPSLFELSEDDFRKILGGSKNLKEKNSNNKLFLDVISFYNQKKFLPSVFGQNDEEVVLAKKLIYYYDYLVDSQQNAITSLVGSNLSLIEKVSYGKVMNISYSQLYYEIDRFIELRVNIGDNVLSLLKKDNVIKNNIYIDKICENNRYYLGLIDVKYNANNIKKDDAKLKDKFGVNMDILFREDFSQNLKFYLEEFNKLEDQKGYLYDLANEIIQFIKTNYRLPEFKENEKDLFYKKIIFSSYLKEYGLDDKINKIREVVINEISIQKRKVILDKILNYMEEHNGVLPTKFSDDGYEVRLFSEYNKNLGDFTTEDFSKILAVRDKYQNYRVALIKRYLSFVKNKKRVPLISACDDYEKKLAVEFQGSYQLFSDEEKMVIDSCLEHLDKYEQTRQLYKNMLELRKKGR